MSKRHCKHRFIKFILFLIIVAALFYVGLGLYERYSLGKEKANLYTYFNIGNDEVAVIYNDKIVETKGLTIDEEFYLPIDFVQNNICSRFYYANELEQLVYVLPKDILYASINSNNYVVSDKNRKTDYNILTKQSDAIYINTKFVSKYSECNIRTYKKPNRIQVETKTNIKASTVKDDTQVRILGGNKSPILKEIKKDVDVEVIEIGKPWTKVHTSDGFIGYVLNRKLSNPKDIRLKLSKPKFKYKTRNMKDNVSLVWDQVRSENANATLSDRLQNNKGINVIAPTWFYINNTSGEISSLANEDYVNYAHTLGIKVWGTVNDYDAQTLNGGMNSFEETKALLSNSQSRSHVIDMLINESNRVHLDGINIDIEKLDGNNSIDFVQFIRELSLKCHENKLLLSVDTYPPLYTKFIDRKELNTFADYMIVMAYNENGLSNENVGADATLGFSEDAIMDSIKEGYKESKLILGIPLYSRVWALGKETGLETRTIDMKTAHELSNNPNASTKWDKSSGTNYSEWIGDDGYTRKLWIEDEKSIELKMDLYKKYNLKGVAFWKLGLEESSIWESINDNLK